jgi:FkbM family methyltransferase
MPTSRGSFRRRLGGVPGLGYVLRWVADIIRLPAIKRGLGQDMRSMSDQMAHITAAQARLEAAVQRQLADASDASQAFVLEQMKASADSVAQVLASQRSCTEEELRSQKASTVTELAALKQTVARSRLELSDLISQFRENQMASRRWDAVADLADDTQSQLRAHYGFGNETALVPHILGLLQHLEQEVQRLFDVHVERARKDEEIALASLSIAPRASAAPTHEPARLSCYLGDHRVLTRTQRGLMLVCSSRDLQITPAIVSSGLWEETTSVLFEWLLRPGGAYLEIGANIGYFTTLAATYVGHHGSVFVFEPNPDAFSLLEENLRINRQTYLSTLRRKAVADRPGTRTMNVFIRNLPSSTLSSLDTSLLKEMGEDVATVDVDCTTLDEEFRQSDARFDFLKIDAEGAEPLILAGAKEFLTRNLTPDSIILLEWNPVAMRGLNASGAHLLSILEEHGFSVFQVSSRNVLKTVHTPEDLDTWCNADLIATRTVERLTEKRFQVD